MMTYDVIALACEQLSYRDKLRLAQLLIQTARKEEENANPQNRAEPKIVENAKEGLLNEIDNIGYVVERLLKLKPRGGPGKLDRLLRWIPDSRKKGIRRYGKEKESFPVVQGEGRG